MGLSLQRRGAPPPSPGDSLDRRSPGRFGLGFSRLGSRRAAGAALALVCLAAAPLHLYLSRGWVPFGDEIGWASQYRGLLSGVLGTWFGWFDPLGRLTYNVLFASAGIDNYLPFSVLALVCNLLLVGAVWVYCAHIGRPWSGVAVGAFLLVFGNGVHSLLYGLNSFNALGIATLPLGLVLLSGNSPSRDRLALAAVLIGLGFDGPVVVGVSAGLALFLAGRPSRPSRLWIAAVPVVVHGLALFALPEFGFTRPLPGLMTLFRVPRFALEAAAGAAAAGLGVGARWGPWILAAIVVWAVAATPRLDPQARRRMLALAAAAAAIWALLGLARGEAGNLDTSRYLVLGVVPILLFMVELSRAARRPMLALVFLAILIAGGASNLRTLVDFGGAFRFQSEVERAHVTAIELAGERAPDGYRSASGASAAVMFVDAGGWRRVRTNVGSFGLSESQALELSEYSRLELDRVAKELGGVRAFRVPKAATPPAKDCSSPSGPQWETVLSPSGLEVTPAGADQVAIRLRRVAATFPSAADLIAPPGMTTRLFEVDDAWATPWVLQITGNFVACPVAFPVGQPVG